eukprot:260600_1
MNCFAWKAHTMRNDNEAPHFMDNYIQYRHTSLSKPKHEMVTNIVISDGIISPDQRQIDTTSSCYVPDLRTIVSSNDEFLSKCASYSITNPCAIINSGVIESDPKSLSIHPDRNNAFCSAIVVDKTCLNDRHTQNTYGFEFNLPRFPRHVCDDLIYSPCTQSVIAYQSFYSKCNKLYYLNKSHSDWRLLTQINWTKSPSPASMIPFDHDKQLFISTNSGESVCFDLVHNKWQRTSILDGVIKPCAFDEVPFVPSRPVFAYNEYYNQMVRMNVNKDTNYSFDFVKNKWIKMNFQNRIKNRIIEHQTVFVNDASPHVLYTMIHTPKNVLYCAYCDQRDHKQNKWKVMWSGDERDATLSVF